MQRRAIVLWFTGMSGAGKTTLAIALRESLTRDGSRVLILDGDDVRDNLHRHLGFTPEDIRLNNELIVGLCAKICQDADIILVPIISRFRDSRQSARDRLSPGFHEIHISAHLTTLQKRDTKGLYGAAQRREINNLIGVAPDIPYETPQCAELTIHTDKESLEISVSRLLQYARSFLTNGDKDGSA